MKNKKHTPKNKKFSTHRYQFTFLRAPAFGLTPMQTIFSIAMEKQEKKLFNFHAKKSSKKKTRKKFFVFFLPSPDNDLKVGVVKHHVVAQSIGALIR